jgi:hypothetical protein
LEQTYNRTNCLGLDSNRGFAERIFPVLVKPPAVLCLYGLERRKNCGDEHHANVRECNKKVVQGLLPETMNAPMLRSMARSALSA